MNKAAGTRLHILQTAFGLIYRKGFQATSIDDIIAQTSLTKGAFFYHFKSKEEMGLAMIHEVMYPGMREAMIGPLTATDPIQEIRTMMRDLLLVSPLFEVKYGCPAVNLIEEMSPLNASFSQALQQLSDAWQHALERCLEQAKTTGQVRKDVNAGRVACFLQAGYNGIRNIGKIRGKQAYADYLDELDAYLDSLR